MYWTKHISLLLYILMSKASSSSNESIGYSISRVGKKQWQNSKTQWQNTNLPSEELLYFICDDCGKASIILTIAHHYTMQTSTLCKPVIPIILYHYVSDKMTRTSVFQNMLRQGYHYTWYVKVYLSFQTAIKCSLLFLIVRNQKRLPAERHWTS